MSVAASNSKDGEQNTALRSRVISAAPPHKNTGGGTNDSASCTSRLTTLPVVMLRGSAPEGWTYIEPDDALSGGIGGNHPVRVRRRRGTGTGSLRVRVATLPRVRVVVSGGSVGEDVVGDAGTEPGASISDEAEPRRMRAMVDLM